MSEYRIMLTQRAKDDITDIGDYISYTLSEPATSQKFIKGLRHSISQLKNFPYKFPLVHDDILQTQGIRCMPHKNFYIFYKIDEAVFLVIVLLIGYNKRNWKNFLHKPIICFRISCTIKTTKAFAFVAFINIIFILTSLP